MTVSSINLKINQRKSEVFVKSHQFWKNSREQRRNREESFSVETLASIFNIGHGCLA